MDIKPLILIIEDDKPIARFLEISMETQGYRYISTKFGKEGIALAYSHNPDMIILDLGLPDIDGLEVIEKIKENLNIKIIVVSAREHERQKVDALDKGADDYLTKPFSIPELLVRIRVAFRNKSDKQDKSENIEFYEFNGLKVDYEKRQVLVDNVEIKLTPIEYKLVELLSKHSGRFSRTNSLLKRLGALIWKVIIRLLEFLWQILEKKLNQILQILSI